MLFQADLSPLEDSKGTRNADMSQAELARALKIPTLVHGTVTSLC